MFTGNTRNNQDILDYFIRQFIVNGAPRCTNSSANCMYSPQNDNQIGCAIGCLLSPTDREVWDSLGNPSLNAIGWISCIYSDQYEKYFDKSQLDFLTTLQRIHDNNIDCDFTPDILQFAEDFALTIPEDLREDVDNWEAKYVHG